MDSVTIYYKRKRLNKAVESTRKPDGFARLSADVSQLIMRSRTILAIASCLLWLCMSAGCGGDNNPYAPCDSKICGELFPEPWGTASLKLAPTYLGQTPATEIDLSQGQCPGGSDGADRPEPFGPHEVMVEFTIEYDPDYARVPVRLVWIEIAFSNPSADPNNQFLMATRYTVDSTFLEGGTHRFTIPLLDEAGKEELEAAILNPFRRPDNWPEESLFIIARVLEYAVSPHPDGRPGTPLQPEILLELQVGYFDNCEQL